MNVIASGSANYLERITASRQMQQQRAAASRSSASALDYGGANTRVTLGGSSANSSVYGKPGAVRNDVASQMSLNLNGSGLANRWRGLGGALLNQLSQTGENFKQSLTESRPIAPATAGDAAGAAAATDAASATDEASGVLTGAATVSLKIQTRSGQTVELKIASNDGGLGTRGLEVEVNSSGPLSSAEKDALADLADGLDRALDGLGQGAPALDLSKLMNVDSSVFSELDLKVEDPKGLLPNAAPGSLGSFALHLGADKKSIEMKGVNGDLSISVDATSKLGSGGAAQRYSAIDKMLQQIDAAAERGHADPQLAATFKAGFLQLQAPSADQGRQDGGGSDKSERSRHLAVSMLVDDEANPAMSPSLSDEVGKLRSGLADFDASFSGDTQKTNKYGAVKEQGHAAYAISQHTGMKPGSGGEGQSVTETQHEKLTANFLRTRTTMLDTSSGNYDSTRINDEKTITTLIETAKNGISRALRKTDEQQSLIFDSFEKGRSTVHRETPMNRSYVERLR
jgi:hypothetical protein